MLGFGILVAIIGAYLAARPETWWRLNAPVGEKGKPPTDAFLHKTKRNGITLVIGGIALAAVQLFLKQ